MADTVTDRDLRALVELLEEGQRDCPEVGLPPVVLELIQTLVRCDDLSFIEFDPSARRYFLD